LCPHLSFVPEFAWREGGRPGSPSARTAGPRTSVWTGDLLPPRGVRLAVRNLGSRAAQRHAGTPSELIRVMNPTDRGDVGQLAL
jgi:hypothetical protein